MDGSVVLGIDSTFLVCLLGLATVFIGLICIVLICYILSFLMKNFSKEVPVVNEDVVVSSVNNIIPNKQEFVAAVSAAIAEDMGKNVSAIKILSVKKI